MRHRQARYRVTHHYGDIYNGEISIGHRLTTSSHNVKKITTRVLAFSTKNRKLIYENRFS